MARVLAVDDEPDLRELLRVSLTMAGHEVLTAPDGLAGLDLASKERPDVVVLDVMMPYLDGWAVLAALKADPDQGVACIPVLMLTARSEDVDSIRGRIEGAVGYLTKPFSVRELREAVTSALSGGPETDQRRASQRAALVDLARIESGTAPLALPGSRPVPAPARPRMSRLEPVSGPRSFPEVSHGPTGLPAWLDAEDLTAKDRELLGALLACESLAEARRQLQVSRSYLYARVRRVAVKLDFASGPALLKALRSAEVARRELPYGRRVPRPPGAR